MLKAAIRDPNPVICLEHEMLYGQEFDVPPPDGEWVVPIGKAKVRRQGADVTITAHSRMASVCALEAAEQPRRYEKMTPKVIRIFAPASAGHRDHH